MKGSLCPRESFHYEDLNGTKNSAKKLISRSVMTWKRFVTRVGVFPGVGETFLQTRPVLKGLSNKKYFQKI